MTNNSEVKDKTTVENNNSNDTANFSYTNQINTVLEDENRILREAVNSLREEIERFKAPSLMIAEVSELINGHAVIKIPNGNKFYVSLSKNIKNLESGDSVLVEQKNLNIIVNSAAGIIFCGFLLAGSI